MREDDARVEYSRIIAALDGASDVMEAIRVASFRTTRSIHKLRAMLERPDDSPVRFMAVIGMRPK